MALQDALYNTILKLTGKASVGMESILKKTLTPPPSPEGIMSKLKMKVDRHDPIITIETQFPEYAYYTEHGRGEGKMPPYEPIRDWVERHWSVIGRGDSNIESVTYLIRRKIGREGTQGKGFALPLNRMIEMITKTASQVGATVVEDELYSGVKTLKDMNVKL